MTEDYVFFSAAHGTFSKIYHILSHKSNLKEFKKSEIIHGILADHNGIKLKVYSKENHKNHSKS
jgi:hypothetical protein